MITINASPVLNNVLLDANNTVISITSSNGINHFFRALIYINDVLFDEESWSRKDAFTAEKDLKKLFNADFVTQFYNNFDNSLVEQTELTKKINITIVEKLLTDGTIVQTVPLPQFYIMFNTKPAFFDDSLKMQVLGDQNSVLLLPANGKIAIPIFINATNENLSVSLKDNFNNIVNQQSQAAITGKKTFLYTFDFLNVNALANTVFYTLKFTLGTFEIDKKIRLLRFPDYPVKEICYQNNFGYFQFAYLDGVMTQENNIEVLTYEELDNSEVVFEINKSQVYTINSGALLPSEKNIIDEITNSIDTRLLVENQYIKMANATKKQLDFKDNQSNYSENLSFTLKKDNSINNLGLTSSIPALPNLFLNAASVYATSFILDFVLNNNYNPSGINVILNNNGEITTIPVSTISPQVVYDIPVGTYAMKLQSQDDLAMFSNEIQLVIVRRNILIQSVNTNPPPNNSILGMQILNQGNVSETGYRIFCFENANFNQIEELPFSKDIVYTANDVQPINRAGFKSSGTWNIYLQKGNIKSNIKTAVITL